MLSKHYFLSKVICFDRRCRGFIGYIASRDKKRFKGFKKEGEVFSLESEYPAGILLLLQTIQLILQKMIIFS